MRSMIVISKDACKHVKHMLLTCYNVRVCVCVCPLQVLEQKTFMRIQALEKANAMLHQEVCSMLDKLSADGMWQYTSAIIPRTANI